MRDPRLDMLPEPMQIGPVAAKKCFDQVPHSNDGGYRDPPAGAEMHRFGIFHHFPSRATGHRMDGYGGSLENWSRFVRDAVGDTMWLTPRVSLDKTMGGPGFPDAKGASLHVVGVGRGPAGLEATRALAEPPVQKGCTVKLMTPAAYVSEWASTRWSSMKPTGGWRRLVSASNSTGASL